MVAVAGRPRNRDFQEPDIGQVQHFLDLFGLLGHPALKSGNDTVPENIIPDQFHGEYQFLEKLQIPILARFLYAGDIGVNENSFHGKF
jgi:hypothetical protein